MNKEAATVFKRVGIVAIALSVLYAVPWGMSKYSLRRAYSALEADGRPMRAEQIIPAPIPDVDNAAFVYKAVVQQLKAERAGEDDLLTHLSALARDFLVETPDPDIVKQFRAIVRSEPTANALLTLEKGTAKSGCRYDLDYQKGAGLLLPHLSNMRSLSRILCAKARLQAIEGDYDDAWRTIIASLRLANALKIDPLLISQLVRMAQFGLTVDAIHTLSTFALPSGQQYTELDGLLKAFDDIAPFITAMDSERLLFGEWAFSLPPTEVSKCLFESDSALLMVGWATIFRPLLHRDHAAYLNIMRFYASNAAAPYHPQDTAVSDQLINEIPRYCIFTRMLVPALSACKGRHLLMIAQSRITRAGLAALMYRHKHDAYPADLSVLNIQDLTDPFSQNRLIYGVTPSGFTVYSIGEDLVDDGGNKGKKRRSGDIVWRYTAE
ncbi:hypothetical protein ACFLS1_05495 [Verrucomicrobiota bacterium]